MIEGLTAYPKPLPQEGALRKAVFIKASNMDYGNRNGKDSFERLRVSGYSGEQSVRQMAGPNIRLALFSQDRSHIMRVGLDELNARFFIPKT